MSGKLSNSLIVAFKYILDYHFGDVSLETIRNITPIGSDSIKDSVAQISKSALLEVENKVVTPQDISTHEVPALLLLDDSILVLVKKTDSILTIFDPLEGKFRDTNIEEFAKKEIDFYYFEPKVKEEEEQISESSKEWFWRHFKAEWKKIAEISVMTLFINLFMLAIPLYVLNVYDRVIPNSAYETLFTLTVGFLIVIIFEFVLKNIRVIEVEKLGKKILSKLEEQLFETVITSSEDGDRRHTGSRVNLFRELTQISDFFASKTVLHLLDLPFFFLMLFVAWLISPPIAFAMFLGALIIFASSMFIYWPLNKKSRDMFMKSQNRQNFLLESINGKNVLKLNQGTNNRIFEWSRVVAKLNSIGLNIQFLQSLSSNSANLVLQLTTIAVIVIGVFQIESQSLSLGGLIALMILSSRTMVPIVHLSSILIKTKEMLLNLDTIEEYIEDSTPKTDSQRLGARKLKGLIEFDRVSYGFEKASSPVLNECSFTIRAGERVGIIGRSGAGKSTILKLISRLYSLQSGSIKIDGHILETIHEAELTQSIGVVEQEPYLFATSIQNNIEIGSKVGKDRLIKLIHALGMENLLKATKDAEDRFVGEKGNNLSVGEKQLIALARALVHNPNILLLDEPTSSMDMTTELEIVKRLDMLIKNKTLIMVSHRPQPLKICDRIIYIDSGKVIMDGPREKVFATLNSKN